MAERFLLTICALVLAFAGAVQAGPVLDEVLNYMYLDQTTPIHPRFETFNVENAISLTKDAPIGQTFVTGPDVERVIRIRTWIEPNADWQKGEGVEMVLWDSPQKKTALGRYTIWYEFRGFQHNRTEFEVKAEVKPNTSYYFEMSYVGEGDGKLSRIGLMNGTDSYKSGQGYKAGKEDNFDVCFQTHCKRPMDRVGNLKKAFGRFNLDRPELAEVKQAVDKEDFDTAVAKLIAYFEARQTPVPVIEPGNEPKNNPDFDTKEADRAMDNYFSGEPGKGYGGPDMNWRGEPDFNPDGTIAASFWNTSVNRYGARMALINAYSNTGNDKYAAKMNDLLIDYYLDNPPPAVSKLGGDGDDPVWATLDCGARLAPAFVAYKRIHKSPAFTLDCRMAYILDLGDMADTLVLNGANDGGNWAFTQNSALFEFGLNFPEFKNSEEWCKAASDRLAIVIKRDILPDGVENESAPGYQRMSYRPLVNVYNLMIERGAKMPFGDELKGVIEKQAEYFMYLAAPNGQAPYLGDWGNDDERLALRADSELLGRKDMLYVASAGKEGVKPSELSKLYPNAGILTMRSDWGDAGKPFDDARYLMMHAQHYGSHGHSDLNGITLYAYGRELLKDPGAYEYGSPEHDLLGKSVSHNMMTIDGEEHARWPKGEFKAWVTNPVMDYISSYSELYKSGSHTREIFFVRTNGVPGANDYWIVRDTADGTGIHSLEQRWNLAAGEIRSNPTSLTVRTLFDEGGNLSIMQVDPSRLKLEQKITKSWVPRGAKDGPKLLPNMIYTTNTELPAAIDTALFPYKGKQVPAIQMKTLEKSANGLDSAFKVVQGKTQDLFILQKSAGPKSIASEKVSFNGERLIVRRVGGKLQSIMLVNGSSVTVDGKQVVNAGKPLPWVVVSFDKAATNVYTKEAEPTLKVTAAKGTKIVNH